MADPTFTRCPGCATVFRVTREQLALRDGQVRCGHCRAVFDANSHQVSVDSFPPRDAEESDELLRGRPTVTLRDSRALEPVAPAVEPGAVQAIEPGAAQAPQPGEPTAGSATPSDTATRDDQRASSETGAAEPAAPKPESAPAVSEEELAAARAALRHRAPRPRSGNAFYLFSMVVLILGLGAQAVLEFHDSLAVRVPRLAPALASACRWLSCAIGPPREASALSIEGSDLQADPGHQGLLILTATVRNRSAYAVAYPHLELTLTDAADQVVVRRAFAPSEYLRGNADRDAGIAGNREQLVRMFIDASTTRQAGYRLYLFYP